MCCFYILSCQNSMNISRTNCSSNMICHLLKPMKVIPSLYIFSPQFSSLFTSLTFFRTHQVWIPLPSTAGGSKNAEQDNVSKSLEDDEIKKTKADKENTCKLYVCNICGTYFMYEKGLFDHASNCHNNCTVCNIQPQ